jgi:hypothetical protein
MAARPLAKTVRRHAWRRELQTLTSGRESVAFSSDCLNVLGILGIV